MAILFTLRFLPEIFCQEITAEILFVFGFDVWLTWGSNPDFTSNMPTHYILDDDDFKTYAHMYT